MLRMVMHLIVMASSMLVIACLQMGAAVEPCHPSPCGPNSECNVVKDKAYCICLYGNKGTPPNCPHPTKSVVPNAATATSNKSECRSDQVYVNKHCINPCEQDTCGTNAKCTVHDHQTLCICPPGYTGDPFNVCKVISE